MNYKRELLDRIRNGIDIVEYIGEHVDLIKRGDSYLGLCPFHQDSSPSMRVHPVRKIFKCFGCGEGGSVITFAMKYHEISFPEAVESLASLAKVPLPDSADSLHISKMLRYIDDLKNAFVQARRGNISTVRNTIQFSDELLDFFEVGLAPKSMVLYERDLAWELGLITEQGWPYFYERVMFPIKNPSGQVVGFYGRTTKEEGIKHLISKNSRIFRKANTLFGFHEAKKTIRELNTCYLVEGPKDVLALWAQGIKNVVATCGTSLNDKQAKLITYSTNNVMLAYDNDEGGIKAALKNSETLLEHGAALTYVALPQGKDPYDCYIESGRVPIEDIISLPTLLTTVYPIETPNDKLNYTKAFLSIIEHGKNKIINQSLIERAAVVLNLPTRLIWEQFESRPYKFDLGDTPRTKSVKVEPWHQLILGLSYAPNYAPKVLSFLDSQLGDYSRAKEVIQIMVDGKIENQAQWMDVAAGAYLNVPLHDDTLDMLSDPEIAEYIEVATKSLVGSNLMDILKRTIAQGDLEGAERIKQCLTLLQSTKIIDSSGTTSS
jgi:DNA primase catalytic core